MFTIIELQCMYQQQDEKVSSLRAWSVQPSGQMSGMVWNLIDTIAQETFIQMGG